MKKFKVGVTGGGFVGSELCKDLLWNGYEVLCIDNLYLPCDHLFGLIDHSVNNKIPFSFERFDITDLRLDKVFADCDAIIHTAGIVGAPKVDRDPKLAHEYNITGTRNIARIAGKRPVVFCSSGSAYGRIEELCTETTPMNPTSLYGEQKKIGQEIIGELENSISLIFSTGAGVGLKYRRSLLPNTYVYDAVKYGEINLSQPENYRTFISVKDMSSALIWAMASLVDKTNSYKEYNCGDESLNMTKDELAKKVQQKTGCKLRYDHDYVDPDNRSYRVSFDRIHSEGWCTNIDMDTIIDDLIQATKIAMEKDYE